MTQKEVRAAIIKNGAYVDTVDRKKRYKVPCQGCGKDIFSDEEGEIGASVSKRGSANFWHMKCQGKVWDSKIK